MSDYFEWDEDKRLSNIEKHAIDFVDAVLVFAGGHLIKRSEYSHEERYVCLGRVSGRGVAVIFTWRGKRKRIISARRVRKNEEKALKILERKSSPIQNGLGSV